MKLFLYITAIIVGLINSAEAQYNTNTMTHPRRQISTPSSATTSTTVKTKISAEQIYSWAMYRNARAINYTKKYINITNDKGETALCIAQKRNDREAYKLLLSFGASTDVACHRSEVPLTAIKTVEKVEPSKTAYIVGGVAAAGAIAAIASGGGGGGGSHINCEEGYSANIKDASDCKTTGSAGWRVEIVGQCGKCIKKDKEGECDITKQSAADCGTSGANGWDYSYNGYVGNDKCGICTPKQCQNGATTESTCPDVDKKSWQAIKSGFTGDEQCYTCKYTCDTKQGYFDDRPTCEQGHGYLCEQSQDVQGCWIKNTSKYKDCSPGYKIHENNCSDRSAEGLINPYLGEANGEMSGEQQCRKCMYNIDTTGGAFFDNKETCEQTTGFYCIENPTEDGYVIFTPTSQCADHLGYYGDASNLQGHQTTTASNGCIVVTGECVQNPDSNENNYATSIKYCPAGVGEGDNGWGLGSGATANTTTGSKVTCYKCNPDSCPEGSISEKDAEPCADTGYESIESTRNYVENAYNGIYQCVEDKCTTKCKAGHNIQEQNPNINYKTETNGTITCTWIENIQEACKPGWTFGGGGTGENKKETLCPYGDYETTSFKNNNYAPAFCYKCEETDCPQSTYSGNSTNFCLDDQVYAEELILSGKYAGEHECFRCVYKCNENSGYFSSKETCQEKTGYECTQTPEKVYEDDFQTVNCYKATDTYYCNNDEGNYATKKECNNARTDKLNHSCTQDATTQCWYIDQYKASACDEGEQVGSCSQILGLHLVEEPSDHDNTDAITMEFCRKCSYPSCSDGYTESCPEGSNCIKSGGTTDDGNYCYHVNGNNPCKISEGYYPTGQCPDGATCEQVSEYCVKVQNCDPNIGLYYSCPIGFDCSYDSGCYTTNGSCLYNMDNNENQYTQPDNVSGCADNTPTDAGSLAWDLGEIYTAIDNTTTKQVQCQKCIPNGCSNGVSSTTKEKPSCDKTANNSQAFTYTRTELTNDYNGVYSCYSNECTLTCNSYYTSKQNEGIKYDGYEEDGLTCYHATGCDEDKGYKQEETRLSRNDCKEQLGNPDLADADYEYKSVKASYTGSNNQFWCNKCELTPEADKCPSFVKDNKPYSLNCKAIPGFTYVDGAPTELTASGKTCGECTCTGEAKANSSCPAGKVLRHSTLGTLTCYYCSDEVQIDKLTKTNINNKTIELTEADADKDTGDILGASNENGKITINAATINAEDGTDWGTGTINIESNSTKPTSVVAGIYANIDDDNDGVMDEDSAIYNTYITGNRNATEVTGNINITLGVDTNDNTAIGMYSNGTIYNAYNENNRTTESNININDTYSDKKNNTIYGILSRDDTNDDYENPFNVYNSHVNLSKVDYSNGVAGVATIDIKSNTQKQIYGIFSDGDIYNALSTHSVVGGNITESTNSENIGEIKINSTNASKIYGMYGKNVYNTSANHAHAEVIGNITINNTSTKADIYGIYATKDVYLSHGSGINTTISSNINITTNSEDEKFVVGAYSKDGSIYDKIYDASQITIEGSGEANYYGLLTNKNQNGAVNNSGLIKITSTGDIFNSATGAESTSMSGGFAGNTGEITINMTRGYAVGLKAGQTNNSGEISITNDNGGATGLKGGFINTGTVTIKAPSGDVSGAEGAGDNNKTIKVITEDGNAKGITNGSHASSIKNETTDSNNPATITVSGTIGENAGIYVKGSNDDEDTNKRAYIINSGNIEVSTNSTKTQNINDEEMPNRLYGIYSDTDDENIKHNLISSVYNSKGGTITVTNNGKDNNFSTYGIYRGESDNTIFMWGPNYYGSIYNSSTINVDNKSTYIYTSGANSTPIAHAYGIYSEGHVYNQTEDEKYPAKINVSSASGNAYGIYLNGKNATDNDTAITVLNDYKSEINVTAKTYNNNANSAYGIYSENYINTTNNGKISVEDKTDTYTYLSSTNIYGIYQSGGNIINNENAEINVKNEKGYNQNEVSAIKLIADESRNELSSIENSGTIKAERTAGDIYGIYTNSYVSNLNGGKIYATTLNGTAYGIYNINNGATTDITNSGEIYATSNNGNAYAIYNIGKSNVFIDDDKSVTTASTTIGEAVGIYSSIKNIDIYQGTINAIATTGDVYGIKTDSGSVDNGGEIYSTTTEGNAYGIYSNSGDIVNNGVIDSQSGKGGDAYGIYSVSGNITNTENIYVSAQDGNAYGIYLKEGYYKSIVNSGTITVTNDSTDTSHKTVGIYVETPIVNNDPNSRVKITNTGIIYVSGPNAEIFGSTDKEALNISQSGSGYINGTCTTGACPTATVLNSGTVKFAGIVDINDMDTKLVLEEGGTYEAESFSGDISVGTSVVSEGQEDTYVAEDAIKAEDVSDLNLKSESAMFNTELKQNNTGNYDAVATRRNFQEFAPNKSIASYLEQNYQAGTLENVYAELKTLGTDADVTKDIVHKTGADFLINLPQENLNAIRDTTEVIADAILTPTEDQYRISSGAHVYYQESDNHGLASGYENTMSSAYMYGDKRINNNNRLGLGLAFMQMDSSYDMGASRDENFVSVFVPWLHKFSDNLRLTSILTAGYGYGDYERGTQEADINDYIYGVTNKLAYNINLADYAELEPSLILNVLGYYQDEMDDDEIVVKAENHLSAEVGAGLFIKKELMDDKYGKLTARVGGVYYHELADPYNKMRAGFKGGVGSYEINDFANIYSRDRAVLSAMLDYNYKQIGVYAKYHHLLQKNDAKNFDFGVKYNF